MLPSSPGQPTPGRSNRARLTRRGVLGAAAVLASAGIADSIRQSGHDTLNPLRRSAQRRANRAISAADHSPESTVSSVAPHPSNPTAQATTPTAHPTHPAAQHSSNPGSHRATTGHAAQPTDHRANGRPNQAAERVALPAATLRVRDRPIYNVSELVPNAPKHAIALTIDDGPDPHYTPKVLRLLDRYRMQASFCVVGVHAEAYPKLIRDIARAGHVIVNHTYTHVEPFNRQTERRIVDEITRTQRTIERAARVTPHLFRAPGGEWSPFIFRAVATYDLLPLDWDVDPADWARPGTRRIERRMLRARPNDIVLCHDGGGNRAETVRALRRVLPTWKRRGYITVPLVPPSNVLAPPPPSGSPSPTGSSSPSTSSSPSPTPTPSSSPPSASP
jgi:peptidoglycan/xylan/chitin deacetylase (PgdA/CDA1 family)